MKKLVAVIVPLILLNVASWAQDISKPFVLGKVDELWSVELREPRVLNIYLPEGYDKDKDKTYPVIYLLDGSANEDFVHVVGVVQFLNMIEAVPPTIIVGIANVDRKRDMTFPTSVAKDKKDFPTTGGSEKFIGFIEKELQPYIEHRYRVNKNSRTLIGQSLGGLFATEVLLKKPGLFDNYIIVSPSLWWDNESLLGIAPALLRSFPPQNINVSVMVGNEEKVMVDDAQKLVFLLHEQQRTNLHVTYYNLADEDHLTILHNAVYKALNKPGTK
jgi:uncharacterized protein